MGLCEKSMFVPVGPINGFVAHFLSYTDLEIITTWVFWQCTNNNIFFEKKRKGGKINGKRQHGDDCQ